ncbi:MBL fold metallo-hydrolase [Coralliovum pocilloporae]|uniref:MBL fold metallo-hydrolase n=1 Tax=Coralliovum pocilloporae TaxID=3066369 RepID=UPI00330707DA
MSDQVKVRFWGVRGSIPCCTEKTSRFGGDTACIEVSCGDDVIIIDCGSGMMHLGHDLERRGLKTMDLFVTHYHFDHLCGLPFFCIGFNPETTVNAYGPVLDNGVTMKDAVSKLMEPPLFPITSALLKGVHFNDFEAGASTTLSNSAVVHSIPLNHPGGGCGYRIDWHGRSVAIITDFEHASTGLDQGLKDFVRGADVMVYDAMYTSADYPSHVGWGHSTDDFCLSLAEESGVGIPVLFHHAPYRSDASLEKLETEVSARFPGAMVGYDGLEVVLSITEA